MRLFHTSYFPKLCLIAGLWMSLPFLAAAQNPAISTATISRDQVILQNNSNRFSQQSSSRASGRVSALLDSAQYLASRVPLRAIDYVNAAITLSLEEKDSRNEALAYLILGDIQQSLKQDELAIGNYRKSIRTIGLQGGSRISSVSSMASTQNLLTEFTAWRQMAKSLLLLDRTEEAQTSINTCFESRFSQIAARQKLEAKRVLASVKFRQGKTAESLAIFNEVMEQEKAMKNNQGLAETFSGLGNVYQGQNMDSKAIEYYDLSNGLANEQGNQSLKLFNNNQKASIYRKQSELDKELEVRNTNIALSQIDNNTTDIVQQNTEIGNAYLQSNQPDKAALFYDKNLKQINYTDNPLLLTKPFEKSELLENNARSYRLLAEHYLRQGQTATGLRYLNTYAALQDSIRNQRQRELDKALALSTSIGKNQQRIELLEKERQLNEKSISVLKQDQELREEELTARNSVIITLCLFILSLLLGGYFIIKSAREKRRANQMLAIRSLRGQMNPHFIFNALNSVNHYISQNDERSANRYLSDFSKLMRSVMNSSRNDLVVLSEEIEILKLYLQLEHARFSDKFSYTFTVADEIDSAAFELPPMLIQPYIENAVWHGLRYLDHKGQLDVVFDEAPGELTVSITDNGIGRQRSAELKTRNQKSQLSVGMQNIESRIAMINKLYKTNIRVEVSDAFPGQECCGTRVTIHIPKNIRIHA